MTDSFENTTEEIRYEIMVVVESLKTHHALVSELTEVIKGDNVKWYQAAHKSSGFDNFCSNFKFVAVGELSKEKLNAVLESIKRHDILDPGRNDNLSWGTEASFQSSIASAASEKAKSQLLQDVRDHHKDMEVVIRVLEAQTDIPW